MLRYWVLFVCLLNLIVPCHGKSFTANPIQLVLCGSNQTNSLTLSCEPTTPGITQVFAIEIGKIVGATRSAFSHITVEDPDTVVDVATGLSSRISHQGSISGRSGNLSVTLTNLNDSDSSQYYCSTSYMTNVLSNDYITETVTLKSLNGSVPFCNGVHVESALTGNRTIHAPAAGKCPNGIAERSEALLMNFCSAPDLSRWVSGRKVLDICCQIPKYTPVATFEFGLYVQDERGMSGVFLECTKDGSGFKMATQLCGHTPITVELKNSDANGYISNANNYFLVEFQNAGGFTPSIVG